MHQMDQGRISSFQNMCLLFLVRMTATTIAFPFMTGNESPTDAWIGVAIGVVVSFVLLELIVRLSLKFPNMTVIQYSQVVLGKFLGKIVALLLIWFWISDAALTTRSLSDAIAANFMPQTPVMVFIVVSLTLAANAARNGIEVIGRWSELVAMAVLASTLVLVLPYSAMRFGNLLPVLPYGFGPHLKRALIVIALYLRLSVVGMIIPCLHNRKEALRYTRYAVLLSGIIMAGHAVSLAAVFGSQATTSGVPGFILARQISIGQFLERIETIPVTIWVLNALVKIAVFIWAAVIGLAQAFGLRRFKPLAYPVGALVALFSMLFFKNYVEQTQFIQNTLPVYVPVLILGISTVLYLGFVFSSISKPGVDKHTMTTEKRPNESK